MAFTLMQCECGAINIRRHPAKLRIASSENRSGYISEDTLSKEAATAWREVKPKLRNNRLVNCDYCVNHWHNDDDPEMVDAIEDAIFSLYWTL